MTGKSVIVCCLILLFSAAAHPQQGTPEWIRALPNLPNRPDLLQGLGTVRSTDNPSDDQTKAENLAQAEVAMQIRVHINSRVDFSAREKSHQGRTEESSQLISEVTSSIATQTVENIIVEKYYDKDAKTWYGYANIPVEEVKRQIEERTRRAEIIAGQYYAGAMSKMDSADIDGAVLQLTRGLEEIIFAENILGKPLIVSRLGDTGTSVAARPKFSNALMEIMSHLTLEAVSGDKQSGERGKPLPSKLLGRLAYGKGSRSYPMQNVKLRCAISKPSSARIDTVVSTGPDGGFACTVHEIESGSENNVLTVQIDSAQFLPLCNAIPEMRPLIQNYSCAFNYSLPSKTNISIAIRIVEDDLQQNAGESPIADEIAKQLTGVRYRIVEGSTLGPQTNGSEMTTALHSGNDDYIVRAFGSSADYIIAGYCSTGKRRSPFPNAYVCAATGSVRVIEAKTGRVIFNSGEKLETGSGSSPEVAGKKALRQLGISIGLDIRKSFDEIFR